jgi:hypothetical protein
MSEFLLWNKENVLLALVAGAAFAITYEPAAYFIRRWLKRFDK